MRIRTKALAVIGTGVGLIILVVTAVSAYLLINQALGIEYKNTNLEIGRLNEALASDIQNIDSKMADWSSWDDTYKFIIDKNPAYIDSNVESNVLFSDSKLNFLIFLDESGQVVWQKAYDFVSAQPIAVPQGIYKYLKPGDLIVSQNDLSRKVAGVLVLPEGPVLVSVRPILDSNGNGPSRGHLVSGRFLDGFELASLSNVTKHSKIQVNLVNDKNLKPEVKEILPALIEKGSLIQKIDSKNMVAYTMINDLYGAPSVFLGVSLARDIYFQSLISVGYFILIISIASTIFMGITYVILGKIVLNPLNSVIDSISKIARERVFSSHVPLKGRDEVYVLASNINFLLDSIELMRLKIKKHSSELENKNHELEDGKRAMLNILEDEKLLEAKIKDERDATQTILNSVGDGILVVDRESVITMINPSAQKMLDVSTKEAVGHNWTEITTTLNNDRELSLADRSFHQVLTNGHEKIVYLDDNHYYRTKSGKTFPVVSITAPILRDGKVVGAVKAFRDATSEKESKKLIEQQIVERTHELTEERSKLMASIEALRKGYVMMDLNENIILTNHHLETLLGAPEGPWTLELLQKRLGDSFNLKDNYKKCLETKKDLEFNEVPFGSKYFEYRINPVYKDSHDQELIGVLMIMGDVTEEKVLARSRDEFFSIASHELRTPLTAIKGNASMILEYFKEQLGNSDLREMVTDIHSSAIRLIGIVNDFLNVSRLEQGRIEFKPEAFDIVSLVHDEIEEYEKTGKMENLYLKLEEVKNAFPPVYADRERTRQVLTNLVGNALKFTKEGGVTLSLEVKDKMINVKVSDTGMGIPVQNQSLLFHKFQQAGSSILTRDVSRGTGLGLYISKLMVEGMGGAIWLEKSVENTGTTFIFSLPIAN